MQRLLLTIICCIQALMLSAVPAKRDRYKLQLADGSYITATMMGDEMLHFFRTDDGRFLQCDTLGIAHYVEAHDIQDRWQARSRRRQAARSKRKAAKGQQTQNKIVGSKRGLVILVQFTDMPFTYSNATFRSFFNEAGYTDEINIGSVRDYFLDASYGQFEFNFDIIGPVTVSQPLAYYGGNNTNGDDKHPAEMVAEAVRIIDEKVDFRKYDWDGDGEVEQVFVIHSGYDEAQSNMRDQIWSHAWALSEAKDEGDGDGPVITADGVTVDSYATSSELRGRSGAALSGIGIACHEFSHCFGLPDFYDTEGNCFGMDSWDLMDYGEYNGGGGTPAGFTSYERMFCGWLEPQELTEPCAVRDMPALTSEPIAYILYNSGKSSEYYLLENRQLEGWDAELAGHGLLILHVDYDRQAWEANTVNTIRTHQRMTIIPADNFLSRFSMAGDTWPGTTGKTELSDTSTPAATLFNANAEGDKLLHHSFTEISETDDGHISFIFDEEALDIAHPNSSPRKGEANAYNLRGQKVGRQYKGIIITDGKKILIQ